MAAWVTIDIQPVEIDSKHWIDVILDGEMTRYGPYLDANTAGATAIQLIRVSRALTNLNRGSGYG